MSYLCHAFIFVGRVDSEYRYACSRGQVPSTKLGDIQIYLFTNLAFSICQLSVQHLNLSSQLQHILSNSSTVPAGKVHS